MTEARREDAERRRRKPRKPPEEVHPVLYYLLVGVGTVATVILLVSAGFGVAEMIATSPSRPVTVPGRTGAGQMPALLFTVLRLGFGVFLGYTTYMAFRDLRPRRRRAG